MQTNNPPLATTPREIIDELRRLQALDDEIRDIRDRRNARLEQLDRLRKVLVHLEREIDDKRGKLAEAEQWHRTKSGEMATEKDRLTKAKSKLAGVTRSREYVAVNKELDVIRKNITKGEDEVEKLVKAIDDFRAAIAREEEKFRDWKAEASQTEAENQAALAIMDGKIAEVDVRRKLIEARLERQIVNRYQKIADARGGAAVVEVVSEACLGCNMTLQPRFIEMVLRASSLVQCPHCNRYLFGEANRATRPDSDLAG